MGRFRFAMVDSSVSIQGFGMFPRCFSVFGGRDPKIGKIASVATLAVLATLLFLYVSNLYPFDFATITEMNWKYSCTKNSGEKQPILRFRVNA